MTADVSEIVAMAPLKRSESVLIRCCGTVGLAWVYCWH